METGTLVAFAVFFFTALSMYVVLEYRRFGKHQETEANAARALGEAVATRKELQGYTKYTEHLAAGKHALVEQLGTLLVRVERDNFHTDVIPSADPKKQPDATIIVRYRVEYVFGFAAVADAMEVAATASGIEIRTPKPKLMGTPAVRPLAHDTPGKAALSAEQMAVIRKLPALSATQATATALDEATLALCAKRLIDFLHAYLTKQPGVKHVPAISVTYL